MPSATNAPKTDDAGDGQQEPDHRVPAPAGIAFTTKHSPQSGNKRAARECHADLQFGELGPAVAAEESHPYNR